jgi:hypothetical protein
MTSLPPDAQLVSVTARADTDGITLTGRWSGGLSATALAVIGGAVPQSPGHLDEAAADALLKQLGRLRTAPWAYDGACWTASVTRHRRIPVQVAQSPPADLDDNGVWLPFDQQTEAVFRAPDGTDLAARITLFQVAGGPPGVGVYFRDKGGNLVRGAVLRWDRGPDADPAVIYWEAPHCEDDQCDDPCGHEQPRP